MTKQNGTDFYFYLSKLEFVYARVSGELWHIYVRYFSVAKVAYGTVERTDTMR